LEVPQNDRTTELKGGPVPGKPSKTRRMQSWCGTGVRSRSC